MNPYHILSHRFIFGYIWQIRAALHMLVTCFSLLLLEPFPWHQQIQVQLSGNNPVLHDGSVPWRLKHLDPMFAGWHPTADHGGIQHVLIAAQQQHLAATFIHVLEVFKICNPGWSATQILMILIDFYHITVHK